MENVDLKFSHVSKRYRIVHQVDNSSPRRNPFARLTARPKVEDFWAVRDVSFEVARGEVLGIIGHNGAGKSTVLKLLSNITTPTSGEIAIRGHLSALIEVGSGFHPELSGRENVFLSGSILGMRRREIAEKLESIVEFSELSEFIDTPVKRYSSGMYVRLGFAIAAHLDPDILLLDEVLAVGDARFQAKCLERIDELRQSGKTIVFISHDLSAVSRLCNRVLLMSHGQVITAGPPAAVISEYTSSAFAPMTSSSVTAISRQCTGEATVTLVSIHDTDGRSVSALQTGDPFLARVGYIARTQVTNVVFELFFYGDSGELACHLTTESDHSPEVIGIVLQPGGGVIEFACHELGLKPGIYHIDLLIERYPRTVDWRTRCTMLRVDPGKPVKGQFHMPSTWRRLEETPRLDDGPTTNESTVVSDNGL